MHPIYKRIVETKGGCWEWTGTRVSGYGQLRYLGKKIYAHRLSFILSNGEIPHGIKVCHECDNPCCINPNHLFLGTQKQNMEDAGRKKRMNGSYKPGHVSVNRKLSNDIIALIKDDIKTRGSLTLRSIADKYGINPTTIRKINLGSIYSQ